MVGQLFLAVGLEQLAFATRLCNEELKDAIDKTSQHKEPIGQRNNEKSQKKNPPDTKTKTINKIKLTK